jgi:hypothetical protein
MASKRVSKKTPKKRMPAKRTTTGKPAASKSRSKAKVAKRPDGGAAVKVTTARKSGARATAAAKRTIKRPSAKAATPRRTPATKIAVRKKTGNARRSPNQLRVTLEVGPKGKRVVAVAPAWPGLERGEKTAEAAIETLRAYLPRYAKVAKLAGRAAEFASNGDVGVDVVERYRGTGSTDFWGISFAFSSVDGQQMSSEDVERELALMQACWSFFDDVRGRVSVELQKGPRGGGRDRDRIVRHVVGVEQDWARKVGVRTPKDAVVVDDVGLNAYRDSYCAAIRAFHSKGESARNWPLRYLIRHTAYHTMDHAWEMEDKDLSGDVGLDGRRQTRSRSAAVTVPHAGTPRGRR